MSRIIAVVTASFAGSFLCSLREASLYGVTTTQVELLRRKRIAGSERLEKLRRRIDGPVAGIAAFNSMAQTVGASWVGALVGEMLGNAWLGLISGIIALTMLLLTEIVPKSIGPAWAGTLAPRLAWVIQIMVWIVYPLAVLCRWLARTINRGAPGQHATEEEILVMADLAARGGTIFDHIVREDDKKTLRELMRPALFVSEDWRAHQLLDCLMKDRQYLAVVTDAGGNLVGVVTLEDVLEYLLGKPIVGEHDSHPQMQHLEKERASFRAMSDDA